MVRARKISSPPPLDSALRELAQFPDQLRLGVPGDTGSSSRMGDEGCPYERSSVEDATGYSNEEQELESRAGEETL